MIEKREKKILSYIVEESDYLGLTELSKLTNVSTRTVSRSLSAINVFLKRFDLSVIYTPNKGYKLNNPDNVDLDFIMKSLDDESYPNESVTLFLHLATYEKVNIFEISELLFVSESTAILRIENTNKFLEPYAVSLKHISKGNYVLRGAEKDIRKVMHDVGFEESGFEITGTFLGDDINAEFPKIKDILLDELLSKEIIISDADVNNLLKSIVISMVRNRKGYILNYSDHEYIPQESFEIIYDVIEKLVDDIEEFGKYEIRYIAGSSGFLAYNFNKSNIVDPEVYKFVDKSLHEIEMETGQTFKYDIAFIEALASHLNTLIYRTKLGSQSFNPMLAEIKSNYPAEMNDAIILAKKIERAYFIKVKEDEIAYLAVHLALLKQKSKSNKSIVIICNYGFGTSQILREKITTEIDAIDLIGIYPLQYMELAIAQKPDVIVSTLPLNNLDVDIPTIVVDDLFSSEINNKIKEILYINNREIKNIKELMSEDMFFRLKEKDSFDVIKVTFSKVQKLQSIPDEVLDGVLERETISSTDIGNLVAIPHVFTDKVDQSFISISILDHPIAWGTEQVQLVVLIVFSSKDKTYASIFREMYNHFNSIKNVTSLIESVNYKDFISKL